MRPLSSRIQLTLLIVTALLMLGLFPKLFDRVRARERSWQSPEVGLLLVARPGNRDYNFHQTVVLVVEVGTERTWGLVLNRQRTPQEEALPEGIERWGGPVHSQEVTTLVRAREPLAGARRILEGLYWQSGPAPEGLPGSASLTFAGLSVWGPGQLEHELARGGWEMMETDAERIFSDPGALWAECIAPHL